jgi:hypothetical protein
MTAVRHIPAGHLCGSSGCNGRGADRHDNLADRPVKVELRLLLVFGEK